MGGCITGASAHRRSRPPSPHSPALPLLESPDTLSPRLSDPGAPPATPSPDDAHPLWGSGSGSPCWAGAGGCWMLWRRRRAAAAGSRTDRYGGELGGALAWGGLQPMGARGARPRAGHPRPRPRPPPSSPPLPLGWGAPCWGPGALGFRAEGPRPTKCCREERTFYWSLGGRGSLPGQGWGRGGGGGGGRAGGAWETSGARGVLWGEKGE